MPASSAPATRRRNFPWALLGLTALFGLFTAGVVELFQLRFEHGDIYPPYSTLRSDPLGAAAFYEALANQPGLHVERNLRPLERFGLGPAALFRPATTPAPGATIEPLTFFYLGADPYAWPFLMQKRAVDRLEEILNGGGRLIITFEPGKNPLTTDRLERSREDALNPATPPPLIRASPSPSPSVTPKPPNARERRLLAEMRRSDLLERWGIDFQRLESRKPAAAPSPSPGRTLFSIPLPPNGSPTPTPIPTPTPVPIAEGRPARPVPGSAFANGEEAPWHTVLDFRVDTPAAQAVGWRSLYEREGKPVIVSRPFGTHGGEIILASDSYFLSNEALRSGPCPALLAALVGTSRSLVFDESHQGVEEQPGLMTLARRYGLQGALAGTGLLVALFIWRNVSSLVPPPAPSSGAQIAAGAVTGRGSSAGFLNLVKRSVPPRELLAACLARWQAGAARCPPDTATVARLQALADAEASRPARERSPAAVYRAMCSALRPGR